GCIKEPGRIPSKQYTSQSGPRATQLRGPLLPSLPRPAGELAWQVQKRGSSVIEHFVRSVVPRLTAAAHQCLWARMLSVNYAASGCGPSCPAAKVAITSEPLASPLPRRLRVLCLRHSKESAAKYPGG